MTVQLLDYLSSFLLRAPLYTSTFLRIQGWKALLVKGYWENFIERPVCQTLPSIVCGLMSCSRSNV